MANQSVGQVSMDLVLNSKGFKQQLTNSVNDAVKSAGNSCTSSISSMFGKLGAVAATAFSVKALFDFGKSAIELGSDLAEVQNVVEVAFGEMSGAADEFAKSALKNFGLSETSAKRYMGTFGAMASSFGYTNKEALGMAETLTGLTGDVASFYNLSSQEAYTKLKSVFTGETESLKELGVVMTQTALDQFALNNGFGKTTKSMTEQEKVALRLAFVTKNLDKASGDFTRTQDSWANQTRILTESWNAFKAQIGQALIQVLTPLIKYLNIILERLIQIGTAFNQFTAKIFGKQELKGANEASQDLSSNIGGIGDATEQAAKQIKKSIMGFDELNTLADNTGSNISEIGAGDFDFDFSQAEESKNLNDDLGKTNETLNKIINRAKELKDLFKEGFNATFDSTGWEKAGKHAENIKKNLKEIANDPEIQNAASKFADKIAENLGRISGSAATIGGNISDNLISGWDIAIENHKDDIKKTMLEVFKFEGIKSDLIASASESVAEISDFLSSDGAEQITGAIDGILVDVGLFGTQIYERLSTDILTMLVKPLTDNTEAIKKNLEEISNAFAPFFTDCEKFVNDVLSYFVDIYDQHIQPAFQWLTNWLSDVVADTNEFFNLIILPFLNDLSEELSDIVSNYLEPLGESLGDLFGSVIDFINLTIQTFAPLFEIFALIDTAVKTLAADTILPILSWILETVIDFIKVIVDTLKNLMDFINKMIQGDIKGALESLVKILDDVMNFIVLSVINLVAKIASAIENGLNMVLGIVNKFLSTDFKIDITSGIKEWLAGTREKLYKKSGKGEEAEHLASGGYVAANTPQLAIIGDNKHEGEIVAPESKIAEAVTAGISAALNGMNFNQGNGNGINDIVIPVILDGNELDRVVVTAEQRRFARNGGR